MRTVTQKAESIIRAHVLRDGYCSVSLAEMILRVKESERYVDEHERMECVRVGV